VLAPGTTIAGYRIDGVLGEGGMAVVYRATQLSLNRIVALKLLAAELGDDAVFRQRFRREGQLQAAIDHLHIVPVYEAGQTEDGLFLAMRLIEGSTLKDLILNHRLEPRRSLRLLTQVAQALDAAHEAGLIHRDIKPQNVLIGSGDHVYLADFGLTKAPDEMSITGTGQFMGTIDYVAPEQIRGEPATAATDCYSLTAVLYECLTNEVPFARPDEVATLNAQLTESPPRVAALRPELPAALDDVIASGLAKDPAQRPSSCSELIRAASRAFSTGGAPATPSPAQPTRRSPSPTDAVEPSQVTRGYGTFAASDMPAPVDPTVLAKPPAAPTVPSRAPAADRPQPATPVRQRASRTPGVLGLLALAVAAIAGGFLIGHTGGGTASASNTNFASVGHVALRYPTGWQLGSGVPPVPGLNFSDPLTLANPRATAGLEAGEVAGGSGPTLLPASLGSHVVGNLPRAEPVLLGNLQAYRYSGLVIRRVPGSLTIYVVPTSVGVATVVCWSSGRSPRAFADQCARVVATLHLVEATAYPLGPSAAYATLLSSTFARLRAASVGPQSQLRAARTPAAQAGSAAQLAQAYAQAATRLSRAVVSPLVRNAHTAVIAALHQLSTGYSGAATAARSGAGAAYGRAVSQVGGGASALAAAVKSLAGLGYQVTS
jgi:serine/threonine protein kinase